MTYDPFRDYSDYNLMTVNPLWTVPKKEDDILKWLKQTTSTLANENEERIRQQLCSLGQYRGYRIEADQVYVDPSSVSIPKRSFPRIIVNHSYELVEQRVSKLTKFKSETEVLAASTEDSDRIDAKIASDVLRTIKYENKYNDLITLALRRCTIMKEGYVFVDWDPAAGEEHPDSKTNKGITITTEDGDKVKIDSPVRIGAHRFRMPFPWDVFLEPKEKEEEVDYVILRSYEHVDVLKHRYPDLKERIEPTKDLASVNVSEFRPRAMKNYAVVYEIWHRSRPYLPEGLRIVATPELVLEGPDKNPISDVPTSKFGNLPFERLTDIDIDGCLYGVASLEMVTLLQKVSDGAITLGAKNVFKGAHLHWIAEQNSVQVAALANKDTVIWYKGAPPTLASPAVNMEQPMKLYEQSKGAMETSMGIQGASRGAPPPNTRAAASLFFYEEQEEERAVGIRAKFNNFAVALDQKILAIAADNYENHDERLIKVLGANKEWMVRHFKVEQLRKPYDIRVVHSSGLPGGKFAKAETLTNLAQALGPDFVTPELVARELDIPLPEIMDTPQRMAQLAAEQEIQSFEKGETPAPPEKYEDLLSKWNVYYRYVQNPKFKELSEKTRERIAEHVRTIEFLLEEKVSDNPDGPLPLALAQIPMFPLFYNLSGPLIQTPPAMQQGQGGGGQQAGPGPNQPQQQQLTPAKQSPTGP